MYSLPSVSQHYKLHVRPLLIPYILPLTQVLPRHKILTVLVMVLAMVLLQVSLTGSVYIVLMVALERYLNICRPFRYTPQVGTYIHDICNCNCWDPWDVAEYSVRWRGLHPLHRALLRPVQPDQVHGVQDGVPGGHRQWHHQVRICINTVIQDKHQSIHFQHYSCKAWGHTFEVKIFFLPLANLIFNFQNGIFI